MKNYFKKFSIMFVMALVIIFGSCVSAFASDEISSNTKLLMHMEDSGFNDECGHAITNHGVKIDNSIYKVGNGSAYFDGKSYLTMSSTDLVFNNSNFSISFRMKSSQSSGSDVQMVGQFSKLDEGEWSIKNRGANDELRVTLGSPYFVNISTESKINDNKWHYIEVSRTNNILYIFVDGKLSKKYELNSDEKVGTTKEPLSIGYNYRDQNYYEGNIDELIINSGMGGHTSDYIPDEEGIVLDKSLINLNINNSQQLTATTTPAGVGVTWSSSDTSIATVDNSGNVTGKSVGQATITATTTDGSNLSATCTVNVTNPIMPGITLNKTSDSLTTGQTDNLIATTTPSGTSVTWTSSDTNIATVDSTGKITAIKAGTVTITASTSNGLTAACALTVTNPTDNSGGTSTGTGGTSTIVNIAHAKGDNTNNAGGDVSIIFNGLPDTTLSVVKTADVKSVYVGDAFTYTIVVTNTGAKTAKSVVINDSAPNHIQFMPSGITTTQGTVDPSSTSSNILVNVGDIPPLGTVTIKIPATVIL